MGSRKAHCLEPSHQRARALKTQAAPPLAPQWQVRGHVWTTNSTSSPVMDHREISSYVQMWVEDICKNHRGWNLHSVIIVNSSFMLRTSKELVTFRCDLVYPPLDVWCFLNCRNINLFLHSNMKICCASAVCWRTWWHQYIINNTTVKTRRPIMKDRQSSIPVDQSVTIMSHCGCLLQTQAFHKWSHYLLHCAFLKYVQENTEIYGSSQC